MAKTWSNFFNALKRAPANAANGRMNVRAPSARKNTMVREILSALLGIALAIGMGALLFALHATAEFGFIVTALTGLTGLILHEVFSRRSWEKIITTRLEATMLGQAKLARDVARAQDDIAGLKDGLAETASALEVQSKRLPIATASLETRMLKLITEKLGSLGRKPQAVKPAPVSDDILFELQSPPPPLKDTPVTKLEQALNPRGKKFSDAVIAEMVRHAVRQQKVEMFVQPVVSLPQRHVKMVELFGRIKGRSGIYLAAERYMKVAANDALVPTIDDRLLRTALEALKSPFSGIAPGVSIMLNIEAKTLGNPTFMKDLTGFLAQDKQMAKRIVFELAQAEIESMPAVIIPVVQALSQLGCRFSMDCIRSRRLNMTLIKKLGIRFVKMNSAWMIREAQSEGGTARLNRLKGQLDAAGVDLIVERIEDEGQLREVLDFNIDYGQGFLFGKPELYAVWRDRQAKPKPGAVA